MKTKKIELSIDFKVDIISQEVMIGISGLINKYNIYIQTSVNDYNSCDLFTKKISVKGEFYNLEQLFDFNKELQEILTSKQNP